MIYAFANGQVAAFGTAMLLRQNPRIMFKPTLGQLIPGAVMLRPGWMERYVPAELRDAARSTLTAFGFSCAGLMFVLVAMNPLLVVAVDPMTWAPFHLFVRPTSMVVLFLIEHAHLRLARARPHLDLADGAVVEGGSDRGN